MRVVLHEYAAGGNTVFETSDDGGEILHEWSGERRVGQRICAFVDVGCDNTDQGVERLLEALTNLTDEIRRRRQPGECVGTNALTHQP